MLELKYSSNGARFPAELCVAQHSAGQCSISNNQGDLWHDEIQPGQMRDRICPMCHCSVTDGYRQHEDEGAMQLAVCSQHCRLCCRIQLQAPGGTLRNVPQSTDHFGTSTGLRTLHGLHTSMPLQVTCYYFLGHRRSQETGAMGARAPP